MGYRRQARERALQCLYQWESTGAELDGLLDRFWRANPASRQIRDFTEVLVRGTVDAVTRIDPLLEQQAENWRLERMGCVDRGILRLGVYELLDQPETPAAVAIDEAIELAKRYSGEQAGTFVNGILDGIRRRLQTEPATDDVSLEARVDQDKATGG